MAAPNPEREYERLAKLCEDAQAPKVFVLCGAEAWFRSRALALLRASPLAAGDCFEIDGADGAQAEARLPAFRVDLQTAGLFGGARLHCLRNADPLVKKQGKALAETLGAIAPGNRLVLELTKLDRRTALAKKCQAEGAVFDFRRLYAKPFDARRSPLSAELVQWLVRHASKRGLRLAPEAALLMSEIVGAEPARLDSELARLVGLFERGADLSAADLRRHLSVSYESSQFDFADHLLAGQHVACLRSLAAMFREGLRDRDGKAIDQAAVFPITTSWLQQSLTRLLAARAELDAGARVGEVSARHGGAFRERFAGQLERHGRASLERIQDHLLRAERRLRSTGEDPRTLLELFVSECLLSPRRSIYGGEEGLS